MSPEAWIAATGTSETHTCTSHTHTCTHQSTHLVQQVLEELDRVLLMERAELRMALADDGFEVRRAHRTCEHFQVLRCAGLGGVGGCVVRECVHACEYRSCVYVSLL